MMLGTPPDWEGIEREYRAGQLSVREIAKRFHISEGYVRKKAGQEGWQRDLTQKVRAATRAKVAEDLEREGREYANGAQTSAHDGAQYANGAQGQHPRTEGKEAEIIDAASDRARDVQRTHRRHIEHLRRTLEMIGSELMETCQKHEEIASAIDQEENARKRHTMERAVSVPARAGAALNLAQALRALVGLERQAYNLDDNPGAENAGIVYNAADAGVL